MIVGIKTSFFLEAISLRSEGNNSQERLPNHKRINGHHLFLRETLVFKSGEFDAKLPLQNFAYVLFIQDSA